jgi:hypothetical protein
MFLAHVLHSREKNAESLEHAQRGLELYRRELGDDHRELGYIKSFIAKLERALESEA